MTYRELYRECVNSLKTANIEDAGFDGAVIFEQAASMKKSELILRGETAVPSECVASARRMVGRRISREPLQYIIGSWEFMGIEFEVGDGVLIPRPETEMLVEYAQRFISKNGASTVFDLCAGSGCIGLSVAKLCGNSRVYLVEKSDKAFAYLEKNIKKLGLTNAVAVKGDITHGIDGFDLPTPDLILSNPPYIESEDIPSLQAEVRFEPVMALDGGADGYDFYRCLAEKWLGCSGKISMAVECGEGQAEQIADMFEKHGAAAQIFNDLSGIQRVVAAVKE